MAIGRSKDTCQRQFSGNCRTHSEPLTETPRDIQRLAGCMLQGYNTVDDVVHTMATGRFLSLVSHEDADYVSTRKPATSLEYATFIADLLVIKKQHSNYRPS